MTSAVFGESGQNPSVHEAPPKYKKAPVVPETIQHLSELVDEKKAEPPASP